MLNKRAAGGKKTADGQKTADVQEPAIHAWRRSDVHLVMVQSHPIGPEGKKKAKQKKT